MKRILLVGCLLLLAGCFGRDVKQADPLPVIKEVPVPVACVDRYPDAPSLIHDSLSPAYQLDVLYGAALTDRTALQIYAGKLEVLVKSCSVIPK